MKKIIITSGGTREYIDDVRVLTNISTGKLGAIIAETFYEDTSEEVEIYYVHSKGTILPEKYTGIEYVSPNKLECIEVKDTQELIGTLANLVPECDIIIHSMAVSDFSFKKSKGIKLKSNSKKDFIKHLKKNIKKNPKVISKIKFWNPEIKLVGFKFEVSLSHAKLIKTALKSLKDNRADYVIANDKKEMQDNKEHIAYIINEDHGVLGCSGKKDIAKQLKSILNI